MPGAIAYLIVVSLPTALLAWLVGPYAGLFFLLLLAVASAYRYWTRRDQEVERKAFWFMALPTYGVIALAIVRILIIG